MMSTRFAAALLALAGSALGPAAQAQDFTQNPKDIFAGCQDDTRAPGGGSEPINPGLEPRVDKFTQRRFASFSMQEIEQGAADAIGALCWARLDGLWQENNRIRLDRSKDNPEVWGADRPELISLTNGNYTSLRHLVIVEPKNRPNSLYISTGLSGEPFVEFRSYDNVPRDAVFRRGGQRKTYTARDKFAFGQELTVDVPRSGRIRLRMGSINFLRPPPDVTESQASGQIESDNPFLLSFTMENLGANRRGYNVVKQDPFFLQQPSTSADIFAEADPKLYSIDERRVVPLGFKLIVDDTGQGMVFRKEIMSSAYDVQRTFSSSLGGSISGAGFLGPLPVQGSVSLDATQSSMNGMERSQSIAQAIGYSRTKKYTIVVDHPYVKLSEDFIDAIGDALRYKNYRELINRFGTHYPYAVTYGAAAMVTQSFTEEEYVMRAREQWGVQTAVSGAVGYDLLGAGGEIRGALDQSTETRSSGKVGDEGAEFVGVGGNGSWNEGSWMAGETPYPILLDLRPLDELLNPMNFPGEPQVYDTVRRNLRAAIANYLQTEARRYPVSRTSMLPQSIAPPPPPPAAEVPQRYLVYVRSLRCSRNLGRARSVKANTLNIFTFRGAYSPKTTLEDLQALNTEFPQSTTKSYDTRDNLPKLEVNCQKDDRSESIGYGGGQPGLLSVSGTAAELTSLNLGLRVDYQFNPGFTVRNEHLYNPFQLGSLSGMKINETRDFWWTVKTATLPDFELKVRVKRKR